MGNISDKNKNSNTKRYVQLYTHSTFIYKSQDLETT